MATYTTSIPGLPKPVTTSFPIIVKLVPLSVGNVRPGIAAHTPRYWVQHETGNPNSLAAGENAYLRMGAEGRQASYHFTGDDREVYVNIPLNEVTWQAADGAGPGNCNGVSYELCVHRDILADPKRKERSRQIAAEMFGVVAAQLGIEKPQRHWDFNYMWEGGDRHHCPDNMMREGYWGTFVANGLKAKAAALGEAVKDAVVYKTPVKPEFYNAIQQQGVVFYGDEHWFRTDGWYEVIADKGADRDQFAYDGSPDVGRRLIKGEQFQAWVVGTAGDGKPWLITPWMTRVRMDALKFITGPSV